MTRPRRRTVEELTPEAREVLLAGFCMETLVSGDRWSEFADGEDGARALWATHRDELVAEWLEREPYGSADGTESRGGPGTRPFGFWYFEAQAARHVTGRAPGQVNLAAMGWGTEACWREHFGRAWGEHLPVETERAYLERHRLLLEEDVSAAGPRPVD